MEAHVQFPILRSPRRGRRRRRACEGEHLLLPDELRDRRAHRAVPESSMASNLADRVRRAHGGVALPLLPPRRTANHLRKTNQRPRRAYRYGGADRRAAASHRRHRQHPGGAAHRSGVDSGARGVEENR